MTSPKIIKRVYFFQAESIGLHVYRTNTLHEKLKAHFEQPPEYFYTSPDWNLFVNKVARSTAG